MTTAETFSELGVNTRRRSTTVLDVRNGWARAYRHVRRLADDPAAWRLGARTPASWTLAAAFAVASVGTGLALPGADVRSDPGPPRDNGVPVALPLSADAPATDQFAFKSPAGAPAVVAAPAAAAAAAPVVPARRTIPLGKGMWLHTFDKAHGGNANAIVSHAVAHGLTHLYVRTGSSRMGFYARPDLDRILPVAHAAGIKVVGWDFPYFNDLYADATRAKEAIDYTTPDGHQIDAFSADIETKSEGTNLSTDNARAYGIRLRELAGPEYPLIATVPRPNPKRWYPYFEVVQHFDAIAPMVYWINRDPVTDVAGAIEALKPFGKPILPVGQAYDPAIDGSPQWTTPSKEQIAAFMRAAADRGIAAVSCWAWNPATPEHWAAITESAQYDFQSLKTRGDAKSVLALQRMLQGLGYPVVPDGVFGPATIQALSDYQRRNGLKPTGWIDEPTVATLARPYKDKQKLEHAGKG